MNRVSKSATKSDPQWLAHKFGGSSLGDAVRIAQVAKVLTALDDDAQVIVVSAMQGVTDTLIGLAHDAAAHDKKHLQDFAALKARHIETAQTLLGKNAGEHLAWLETQFVNLADLLHALELIGSPSPEALDLIQGMGEVLMAKLLAAVFAAQNGACDFLDAREVLVVRQGDLGAVVDWELSAERLSKWRESHSAKRIVVTGFVARDKQGRITTLGRNGSDFSGAIFGALFNAKEIQIWTDVDGVLSADPRLVPEAVLVDAMSYHEACELAYFGAKVLHPQTMAPAIMRSIPVRIRNTFKPDHQGSLISATPSLYPPVKGLSAVRNLAIVNVEGSGMIGVPGTAERLFSALRQANVSVTMISQGSSEHSICCVVAADQATTAMHALRDVFSKELEREQIQSVSVTKGISVLAIVGDGMAGTPGISARLFDSLGRAGINVRAIAQGASERNISVAIDDAESGRALRAVHAAFYLSPQTLSVGVIGPGQVGKSLVDQIAAARERLLRDHNLDLRVRAIANSRKMLLNEQRIDLHEWQKQLENSDTACELTAFTEHVRATHLPHAVILDCSASNAVAERYPQWLAQGIHVITPNKNAGSGDWNRYAAIRHATASSSARFRYEATVGAGLPIIQTLRDLIDTGDVVKAIDGIFSGTLAYLFNVYDGSEKFSTLVRAAREQGYTEPDPRDDLGGMDVARKLVILGREMGMQLSLDQVQVQSLVPESLNGVGRDEFMQQLEALDEPMQLALEKAKSQGKVLRYVAQLTDQGSASVGLVEIGKDHAFAGIRLTDNIVQFTTQRYANNPLVVQGPGAGPEVTAAGVFADLLRVAAALGARV